MTQNTKDRILITGVAGFIGSHLADELLSLDFDVVGLDVVPLEQANTLNFAKSNLAFTYLEGDMRDPEVISELLNFGGKAIFHFASVVGVTHYMNDPLKLIDINLFGTRNLIEQLAGTNVRLIFSSTSEVYGKNPDTPWSEDGDRVLGPTNIDRWSYSSSKAICEHMIFAMYRNGLLKPTIVRFFNVYGPRQKPNYVVSKSLHRVLNGQKPLLYDSGNQTRCMTYVDDAVDCLVKILSEPSVVGEAVNIGSNIENKISDIIFAITENCQTELSSETFKTDDEFGAVYEDIFRRIPDVSKAQALLNWRAKTSLQDGVEQTIQWALMSENSWWLQQDEQ